MMRHPYPFHYKKELVSSFAIQYILDLKRRIQTYFLLGVFDLEWTETAFEMHCFKEDDSSLILPLNLLRLLFENFRQECLSY